MIDTGVLNRIEGIRIIADSYIPDYVYLQTAIPRSKKKRIVMKCRKKYSITIINNKVFWMNSNTLVCSSLYYKLMRNFIKERKLNEKV